jgi:hypothetical protein
MPPKIVQPATLQGVSKVHEALLYRNLEGSKMGKSSLAELLAGDGSASIASAKQVNSILVKMEHSEILHEQRRDEDSDIKISFEIIEFFPKSGQPSRSLDKSGDLRPNNLYLSLILSQRILKHLHSSCVPR